MLVHHFDDCAVHQGLSVGGGQGNLHFLGDPLYLHVGQSGDGCGDVAPFEGASSYVEHIGSAIGSCRRASRGT